jgi:hypothetical protein
MLTDNDGATMMAGMEKTPDEVKAAALAFVITNRAASLMVEQPDVLTGAIAAYRSTYAMLRKELGMTREEAIGFTRTVVEAATATVALAAGPDAFPGMTNAQVVAHVESVARRAAETVERES